MKLDLFHLHDHEKDRKPTKWICASGNDLIEGINEILSDIERDKGYTRWGIVKILSPQLKCSKSCVAQVIYGKKSFVPLIIIDSLLSLYSQKKRRKLKKEIQETFEILKSNWPTSKPVKTIKNLTINLCKICGAHAADGYLREKGDEYKIVLIDKDEIAVKKYCEWLNNSFGTNFQAKRAKEDAWEVRIKNKIICRYLRRLFDFPTNKKSHVVDEPQIIKKSDLKFRKAFALGVLTFDGSVDFTGRILLGCRSKPLAESVSEIVKRDGLHARFTSSHGKKVWNVKTSQNLNKNEYEKWLEYFVESTEKSWKIYELTHGFQGKIKKESDALLVLKTIYPITHQSICMDELFLKAHTLKKFTFEELFSELNEKINRKSLFNYFYILKRASIVKPHFSLKDPCTRVSLSENIRKNMFQTAKKKTGSRAELSRVLNINCNSLLRWESGSSRTPIWGLKQILKFISWDMDNIKNHIEDIGIEHCKPLTYVFNPNISEWRVPFRSWLSEYYVV